MRGKTDLYIFNVKLKNKTISKSETPSENLSHKPSSISISQKMRTWFGTSRPIEWKCFCIVSLNNQMMKSILKIVSRAAVQKALVSH